MAFSLSGGQGWSMGIDNSLGDAFMIHNSAGGVDSSSQLTIATDGDVGIGTVSPDEKLHISNGKVLIDVTSSIGTELIFKNLAADQFASDKNYHEINFITSATSSETTGGYVRIKAGQEVSGTDNKSYLGFWTAPNAGTVTEKMRIDSDGNVGIGTDSPSYTLAAYANTTGSKVVASFGASLDQSQFTAIGLSGFIASNGATKAGIALKRTGVYGTGELHFLNNNTLDNLDITLSDSKMMIDDTGNVGIGTTSIPAYWSGYTALQLGVDNSIFGNTATGSGSALFIGQNLYNDGSVYKYTGASSNEGSLIDMRSGIISFLNAPTGTGTATVTERMRITSGGDVLLGTQGTPDGTSFYGSAFTDESSDRMVLFQASSATTEVTLQAFYNPNGQVGRINTSGNSTIYYTNSDYRLKEDLQDFAGLDLVSKIPVYDFKWKTDESRSYGVMAHELQEVLPDAVSGEKDAEEMQGVDYSKIVPVLVKAIQELKAEIELLKAK